MPEVIELLKLSPQELEAAIDQTVETLALGEVIVAPLEHSYAYICDAFNKEAVMRLHELRGNPVGVAAQVIIPSASMLAGLSQPVTGVLKDITDKFWPGLLTLNLTQSMSLSWDLGDGGELTEFAVRCPAQDFILKVMEQSGALCITSASAVGNPPARTIEETTALFAYVALTIDGGQLPEGQASTVLSLSREGQATLLREAAITLAQLSEVIPELSAPAE
ncbi:MAG: L-threonylcarbamoyladenylate synthase [Actinobacteria bacterium]|nr:L-threonylcarbamoyladenylate synthase [Actinomycetota bacterium]